MSISYDPARSPLMYLKKPFTLVTTTILLGMLFMVVSFPGNASAEPSDQIGIEQSVTKLYDDLRTIGDAIEKYRAKEGKTPDNLDALVAGGFLQAVPTMGSSLGGGGYEFMKGYDDMDGKGEKDDALYPSTYVPEAICVEFNKRYASAPLNDGTVFDYQAAGGVYPGKVYGTSMKIYAIKWSTTDTNCELNWVVDYN